MKLPPKIMFKHISIMLFHYLYIVSSILCIFLNIQKIPPSKSFYLEIRSIIRTQWMNISFIQYLQSFGIKTMIKSVSLKTLNWSFKYKDFIYSENISLMPPVFLQWVTIIYLCFYLLWNLCKTIFSSFLDYVSVCIMIL